MNVAVMQPYFLPYIGYFQLIGAVDQFILCDSLQYSRGGWINRNRMLMNGRARMFTLPLRKASGFSEISGRMIADGFDRDKLLHLFRVAYHRAPFFPGTDALLESILRNPEQNLFRFVHASIAAVCSHLGIATHLRMLSDIPIGHGLKRLERLFAVCDAVGADAYVNAIGGMSYFSQEAFAERGIRLSFLKPEPVAYEQSGGAFVPWLSIVDLLMFKGPEEVRELVSTGYDLVSHET